jgi:hypothetical protein
MKERKLYSHGIFIDCGDTGGVGGVGSVVLPILVEEREGWLSNFRGNVNVGGEAVFCNVRARQTCNWAIA